MTNDIYECVLHGRGGQGAVTAAELLCEIAYMDGFKDTLSIPIIGAERRGAAIKVFTRLSVSKEIKDYSAVSDADITIIFDMSLLPLPGVLDAMKHGIIILNTNEVVDKSKFPAETQLYVVDATAISLDLKLLVSGSPVTNVPLLGAFAKALDGENMRGISMESLEKVLQEKWGSKSELNIKAAKKAYELTHKI